jgi:hypothetical protein
VPAQLHEPGVREWGLQADRLERAGAARRDTEPLRFGIYVCSRAWQVHHSCAPVPGTTACGSPSMEIVLSCAPSLSRSLYSDRSAPTSAQTKPPARVRSSAVMICPSCGSENRDGAKFLGRKRLAGRESACSDVPPLNPSWLDVPPRGFGACGTRSERGFALKRNTTRAGRARDLARGSREEGPPAAAA